jgi:hypothetical protein
MDEMHAGADAPAVQRLQWMLTALAAHDRGLAAAAACRSADAEAGAATAARQAFLGFLACTGDDQAGRSLTRRLVLAQAFAPLRTSPSGVGRVLRRLRATVR